MRRPRWRQWFGAAFWPLKKWFHLVKSNYKTAIFLHFSSAILILLHTIEFIVFFFQILWNSRCHTYIMVTFRSHLKKKLCSICVYIIWLKKLFSLVKKHHKSTLFILQTANVIVLWTMKVFRAWSLKILKVELF